jgi:hypothetical protein
VIPPARWSDEWKRWIMGRNMLSLVGVFGWHNVKDAFPSSGATSEGYLPPYDVRTLFSLISILTLTILRFVFHKISFEESIVCLLTMNFAIRCSKGRS